MKVSNEIGAVKTQNNLYNGWVNIDSIYMCTNNVIISNISIVT